MNVQFFATNRARLVESLGAEVVVLAGWTNMQWHGDTAVPFRQEANFWYLTGIEQADWQLILDGRSGASWLVAPTLDVVEQLFDGGLSYEDARIISGVDDVLDQDSAERLIASLATKNDAVHTLTPHRVHTHFVPNPSSRRMTSALRRQFKDVKDCRAVLDRLRAIKQPDEVAAIEQAGVVTVKALDRARSRLASCGYEYEVEAEIGYNYRRGGAVHAFEPIVAGGQNACTLHYTANDDILSSGQLLLIDTGARFDGYSADATRTWAVGVPSARYRAVHEAVQVAHQNIVGVVRAGLPLKEYVEAVDGSMRGALIGLGLMKHSGDTEAYRRYFPHAISHGIGIDVHENLGGYKEFHSSMVLTVEPGIYIPEEGVGVRIEDTIVVTEFGSRCLTSGLSTDL